MSKLSISSPISIPWYCSIALNKVDTFFGNQINVFEPCVLEPKCKYVCLLCCDLREVFYSNQLIFRADSFAFFKLIGPIACEQYIATERHSYGVIINGTITIEHIYFEMFGYSAIALRSLSPFYQVPVGGFITFALLLLGRVPGQLHFIVVCQRHRNRAQQFSTHFSFSLLSLKQSPIRFPCVAVWVFVYLLYARACEFFGSFERFFFLFFSSLEFLNNLHNLFLKMVYQPCHNWMCRRL